VSLETLRQARNNIDEAQKILRAEAQSSIKEELRLLFEDPTVHNVTWAQKAGEYNDEGMYPGIFGPALNQFDSELMLSDFGGEEIREWSYDDGYDMLYGGYQVDPRAKRLKEVLNAIGDEILSDLYGEENVVVVLRTENGAKVVSEYVGC